MRAGACLQVPDRQQGHGERTQQHGAAAALSAWGTRSLGFVRMFCGQMAVQCARGIITFAKLHLMLPAISRFKAKGGLVVPSLLTAQVRAAVIEMAEAWVAVAPADPLFEEAVEVRWMEAACELLGS